MQILLCITETAWFCTCYKPWKGSYSSSHSFSRIHGSSNILSYLLLGQLNLWLKITIFLKLHLSKRCLLFNIMVFFTKTSDFVVGSVSYIRLRLTIQRVLLQDVLSLVERLQTWYWEKGNVAEGTNFKKFSIFNQKFNKEKKWPNLDGLGIVG